ncbi:MAG: Rieske 2Fe-2S domain-containing protein [Planctomycetes bacterium]|nr:Rieske 2Fe-2S domain-containing protein [Planctomycetota bacterium]
MSDSFDTGLRPDELNPERPHPLETPWGSFALYVVGGRVHAASSFCPHLEGPLFQGTQRGEVIMCPWHFWCFSLVTGKRVDITGRVFQSAARIQVLPVSQSPAGTIVLGAPLLPT